MAEKGSSKNSAKCRLNAKRFAFDVLSFTLSICGFPEEKLRIKEDKQNDYRNSDYIVRIHAVVTSIALNSRDKWKRVFESRHKSFGLGDKEKMQNYLLKILEVFPEFRSEHSDKTFTSLALFSELLLFLNFKKIEIDFEAFLDLWSSYFNETIALNKNTDEVFGALFSKHPNIHGYLRLVCYFIQQVANSYGKRDDVSEEFGKYTEALESYDDERNSLAEKIRERIVNRLGFVPHNLYHPLPETIEESVSLYSTVLDRDSDLPGNRKSPDPPACQDGASGVEKRLEQMEIGDTKPNQDLKRKPHKTGK